MGSIQSYCAIRPAAVRRIEEALGYLVKLQGVRCALAIDHSGYIVACQGRIEHAPPEDLAAVAAGSFASYEMIVRTQEMTLSFHTKGIDNLHFVRINGSLFIVALFDETAALDKLRAMAVEIADAARHALGAEDTLGSKIGSVKFISAKLTEMFKDV